jgi:opine dehydrogenase
MQDRFIVQDVPYVLVPWYELGAKVGIHSSAIKSIIDLASIVNATNYMETGRNLRRLGLGAASKSQVLETFSATRRSSDDQLRRIA